MLVADRVIVGDGKRVIEQGAVVLDGKRIRAVGTADELRRRFPEKEIRLEGCTLMPGMIDMHTISAITMERKMRTGSQKTGCCGLIL